MSDAVETERLRGERIVSGHHAELLVLLGDPRVGATLGGTLTAEQVTGSVAAKQAHWDRHGFGYWLWREKATGACIGRGGLQHVHVGGRDEVEIGWAVMADRWGDGFATELGRASARVAFRATADLMVGPVAGEVLGDDVVGDLEGAVPELQKPATVELLGVLGHPRIQTSRAVKSSRTARRTIVEPDWRDGPDPG